MATVIDIGPPEPQNGEQYREDLQKDVADLPKVPAPIYRHAAPSAPWPWMDFDVDDSEVLPLPPDIGLDLEWSRYPQSLFGNWTHDQVERCRILQLSPSGKCSIHKVDVYADGKFRKSDEDAFDTPRAFWECLQTSLPSNMRVRALFVENMTVPILQILGTKYNVEPFFFASSVNWIPSRYQEDPQADSDHITVVLPFIRTMKNQKPIERTGPVRTESVPLSIAGSRAEKSLPYKDERQIIDTQAPLLLPDGRMLVQDLLSIHMYRTPEASTIISYHPSGELQRTSARRLQSLVQRTGDSVYWSKLFEKSKDPTFLFLAILWYALYAWDEAFEVLYRYINTLETQVLKLDDIKVTRELHKLQAHLLYYQQLLRDFELSVKFVQEKPNPAMSVLAVDDAEREDSNKHLCTEADNLISEIKRLSGQREMLSDRVKNVIDLSFASVNIKDSKAMQELAQITMIDSAAMKQIAYLTMIFLPAGFLANVFSMNVRQINPGTYPTITMYVEITVGLTILTSWLAISLQKESSFHPKIKYAILGRLLWPFFFVYNSVVTFVRNKVGPKRAEHRPVNQLPPLTL